MSGSESLARAGHAVATAVGIPLMVVGLVVGPLSYVVAASAPAGGVEADGYGVSVLSNLLLWGSFSFSVGGAHMAHQANPGYRKGGMAAGTALGAVGAGLFSAGTIGGPIILYAYAENELSWLDPLIALPFVLAATGTGFAIAGNVTLMASAKAARDDLSGDAASGRRLRSRPRFAAAPLVAPLKEGAVFGLSGLF